jgi:hypothetical protein
MYARYAIGVVGRGRDIATMLGEGEDGADKEIYQWMREVLGNASTRRLSRCTNRRWS